jgi:hypothetical protein
VGWLQFIGPQVLNAIILYLDPTATPAVWVAWLPANYQGHFIVLVLLASGLFQVRASRPGLIASRDSGLADKLTPLFRHACPAPPTRV